MSTNGATGAHEDAFDTREALRLLERRWLPHATPRAAVVIVHGYAEHGGRYMHVGEYLAARGYATYAHDLRGHGRSDGPRALVRSFREHLDDLQIVLQRVRARHPGVPVFLLGHSMGGGIVALAACTDRPDVRGVLLSGAVLPGDPRFTFGGFLIRAIGRLFPSLPLAKLKASDVSRDPETVRLYDADPLNYRGRMRAGLIAAMTRALERINRDTPTVDVPLLVMHGGADALTSPRNSARFVERAGSRDKTLKIYDGLYHEILNEPERNEVLADITAWLDARTGATATDATSNAAAAS